MVNIMSISWRASCVDLLHLSIASVVFDTITLNPRSTSSLFSPSLTGDSAPDVHCCGVGGRDCGELIVAVVSSWLGVPLMSPIFSCMKQTFLVIPFVR